jgi:hypothetical protein
VVHTLLMFSEPPERWFSKHTGYERFPCGYGYEPECLHYVDVMFPRKHYFRSTTFVALWNSFCTLRVRAGATRLRLVKSTEGFYPDLGFRNPTHRNEVEVGHPGTGDETILTRIVSSPSGVGLRNHRLIPGWMPGISPTMLPT